MTKKSSGIIKVDALREILKIAYDEVCYYFELDFRLMQSCQDLQHHSPGFRQEGGRFENRTYFSDVYKNRPSHYPVSLIRDF